MAVGDSKSSENNEVKRNNTTYEKYGQSHQVRMYCAYLFFRLADGGVRKQKLLSHQNSH